MLCSVNYQVLTVAAENECGMKLFTNTMLSLDSGNWVHTRPSKPIIAPDRKKIINCSNCLNFNKITKKIRDRFMAPAF